MGDLRLCERRKPRQMGISGAAAMARKARPRLRISRSGVQILQGAPLRSQQLQGFAGMARSRVLSITFPGRRLRSAGRRRLLAIVEVEMLPQGLGEGLQRADLHVGPSGLQAGDVWLRLADPSSELTLGQPVPHPQSDDGMRDLGVGHLACVRRQHGGVSVPLLFDFLKAPQRVRTGPSTSPPSRCQRSIVSSTLCSARRYTAAGKRSRFFLAPVVTRITAPAPDSPKKAR